MGTLDDILTAWNKVKTDIAAGNYLQAYEDTLDAQRSVLEFGKSLGFKATADAESKSAEIEDTVQECIDTCKADKKMMAAGAFDWKGLLQQLLVGFLTWWTNRPTA